ncbi:MAG: glycosyltransferase family 2 protein [Bacteroidales bacterium]|nr:glycosyltransferase family 2 protein [Bacteroidales bacterium]
MQYPKVSILMACYNGEKYIPRSFGSILSQDWPNIELIMVNDGSSDASMAVAEAYKSLFKKKGYVLKLLSQNNCGACAAIERATHEASGDYFLVLDVDDVIMPESCKLQVEYLEKNTQCNVVRTNGYMVDEGNINDTTRPIVSPKENKTERNIFIDLLLGKTNNWAGAYMIRAHKHREFYANRTMPILKYGQNLQMLLPQTIDAPAGFIDKPLFKYIRNLGSHSYQPGYHKQIENLDGYWQTRYQMLELLELSSDSLIMQKCRCAYYERAIAIALEFGKMDDYERFYNELVSLNGLTLELKMQNAHIKRRYSQYWYRTLYFVSNIGKRLHRVNS